MSKAEDSLQLLIDIEKKAQKFNAREHGLRVPPEEFRTFVAVLSAKVERDDRGEYVTIMTSWGPVRLEPSGRELDIADSIPPRGDTPRSTG